MCGLQRFQATELVPDLYRIPADQSDSFVRIARVSTDDRDISSEELYGLLDVADRELNEVAEFCGAIVIPHSWGMVKQPAGVYDLFDVDNCYMTALPRCLPEGWMLAAKVKRIHPINPHAGLKITASDTFDHLENAIEAYRHSGKDEDRPQKRLLDDIYVPQFVRGLIGKSPQERIILADIDPVLN